MTALLVLSALCVGFAVGWALRGFVEPPRG
jgi:hypothetical protein